MRKREDARERERDPVRERGRENEAEERMQGVSKRFREIGCERETYEVFYAVVKT